MPTTIGTLISTRASIELGQVFEEARCSNTLHWGLGVHESNRFVDDEKSRTMSSYDRLYLLNPDSLEKWLGAIGHLHPDPVGHWKDSHVNGRRIIRRLQYFMRTYRHRDVSDSCKSFYGRSYTQSRDTLVNYMFQPQRDCVVVEANAERRAVCRAVDFVFDICALEAASERYITVITGSDTSAYTAGEVFTESTPASDFCYQKYFEWYDAQRKLPVGASRSRSV